MKRKPARERALELDDGTLLRLAETSVYNDPLGKYLFNGDGSVLVFPDDVCSRLHLARTCYYANTQTDIPYGICDTIRDEIAKMVSRKSLCYFFMPCITAFIIALLVIYSFVVRYGYKVFTYMGSNGFRLGVLIPGLLVSIILVCYYEVTL